MSYDAAGVDEACTDIIPIEPRVAGEDRFCRVTCRQHTEHMLDGQPVVDERGAAGMLGGQRIDDIR